MTKHLDNAALEILRKQEKALKVCHSPALELCNRMSSVLARTSTLEIPAVSCPQSVISAMEQYRSAIAPYCPDFSEISHLAETLQRQLPLTKISPSFSAAIDLPYLRRIFLCSLKCFTIKKQNGSNSSRSAFFIAFYSLVPTD